MPLRREKKTMSVTMPMRTTNTANAIPTRAATDNVAVCRFVSVKEIISDIFVLFDCCGRALDFENVFVCVNVDVDAAVESGIILVFDIVVVVVDVVGMGVVIIVVFVDVVTEAVVVGGIVVDKRFVEREVDDVFVVDGVVVRNVDERRVGTAKQYSLFLLLQFSPPPVTLVQGASGSFAFPKRPEAFTAEFVQLPQSGALYAPFFAVPVQVPTGNVTTLFVSSYKIALPSLPSSKSVKFVATLSLFARTKQVVAIAFNRSKTFALFVLSHAIYFSKPALKGILIQGTVLLLEAKLLQITSAPASPPKSPLCVVDVANTLRHCCALQDDVKYNKT